MLTRKGRYIKNIGSNHTGSLPAGNGKQTFGTQMKRNLLVANILLIAAFFLITLGMRNPSLDHNHGPKQRPRAVVENVSKAPIIIGCELHHLDAVAGPALAVPALSETRSFYRLVLSHSPAVAQLFLPSRASPAPLSRLS